jgi:Fe(3+) dicitrate transport protein
MTACLTLIPTLHAATEQTNASAAVPVDHSASAATVRRMETVQVIDKLQPPEDGPFLPDVEGAEIFAGKRTDNIDPNLLPQINNNNYRQALQTTAGVVLSEESTPLVSIGTRGLPPARMQFMQVLKDGIPIHADMFGYPESYYTPPIDATKRLEIIRGGAALLYGPQPGGAVNYIMEKPPIDTPFRLRSLNTIGSFNYFANFTELGGTVGQLGYYGYYNHRQTDGFRQANSSWTVNNWSGTLAWGAQTTKRTYLIVDAYQNYNQEPGGLTKATGPNAVNWNSNPTGTSRFYDNLNITRYAASLIHENDLSDRAFLTFRGWWNYYGRWSKRQNTQTGGAFGTIPTGHASHSNQIQNQQFYTFGLLPQLRYDYDWLGNTHTITGGAMLYNTQSPITLQTGAQPWASTGTLSNQSWRQNWYTSFFAENRFVFGKFQFIPAIRFENIWQTINESVNVSKSKAGQPLSNESNYAFVPLPGFGAEYKFNDWITAYGNASQSYKPVTFSQAIPSSPNVSVPNNLQPSIAWNFEGGFRGNPRPWLAWQSSYFVLNFYNQIGSVNPTPGTTIIQTIGNSSTIGWDNMLQFDAVGLADDLRGTRSTLKQTGPGDIKQGGTANIHSLVDTFGSVLFTMGYTLQQGTYTSGQYQGKTPQYTPDYLLRLGALYNWRDRMKLGLLSTFSASAYANDNNTQQYLMAAYNVWDFTYEVNLLKDRLSVIGGINNLFDLKYTTRITQTGIDPAMPRNWYVGVQVQF